MTGLPLYLAPLRGVTIRTFRMAFASAIHEAGFVAAVAPFIPANPGLKLRGRVLADLEPVPDGIPLVPQAIGKDPQALRALLRGFKDRGYVRADLNAGCPFPMIRRKGRGSGLLGTPDVLARMLEAGCDEMGAGNFSVKVRLGVNDTSELLRLMPILNAFPLAALTVHARTARQMYTGVPDRAAFEAVAQVSANPVIYNGDATCAEAQDSGDWPNAVKGVMVGRAFLRDLGKRADARELLRHYTALSKAELCGEKPVLGRLKELLAYWAEGDTAWRRRWGRIKICRSLAELEMALG